MGNTTVYLSACAPSDQLHAGDVASLVGLSTQEVSDLLGSSIQDVNSVVAGGTATVAHVAKVLGAVNDMLTVDAAQGLKPNSAFQHKLEGHLSALLAVLGAEAQKGESSLQNCIASLPSFVSACLQCASPQKRVQDALAQTPRLQTLTEQFDGMLASAILI
jgi:isopentenyl diphosphate isomerase/L-lactate dehydrogenase-like FMN-dependent dehydrogenase